MTARDERLYRWLVRLYPADFRARYARAMLDFHRDRIAAARLTRESMLLLRVRIAVDVIGSAIAEHLHQLTRDEAVLQTTLHDLAYAVRGLARRPAFSAIVVATIALGIGANAAIFTVVNGVLLQPLPYPHAERLVSFGHQAPQWLTSEPDFLDYHRELRSFDGLAAYTDREATLTNPDNPTRIRVVRASEDFFPLLGVAPLVGRAFAPDEYATQEANVVLLSYAFWQRRFGGDRSVVGRMIPVDGAQRTVVGVMPSHFAYPQARTDLWMPLARFQPDSMFRDAYYLSVVGRLRPTVPLQSAFVEANGIAKRFMREFPNFYNPREPLTPTLKYVTDDLVGTTRPYLFALVGAVGFVLLIACANVANLLLVRSEARQKEMAVRSALGASRFRLLVQLLVESTLLTSIGGALSLAIAWLGDRVLVALAPGSIPRLDEIHVDLRVVAYTAVIALATGIIVGVVPGLRASGDHAADALKAAGRVVGQGATSGARRTLVVAELALALVTLSGTGLLLRSLWNLQHADLGFDPRHVLAADVALTPRDYDDTNARNFYDQLLPRLRAVPNVVAAGAAGWLPVVGVGGLWGVQPEGRAFIPGQMPLAVPQQITPGYLGAVSIPLVAGRDFTSADEAQSAPVVIVSKRLAETFWPNECAIGRRMKLGNPRKPFATVVGVVGDFRSRGFGDTPEPTFYLPYAQSAVIGYYQPTALSIVLRTRGEPSLLTSALRDAVHSLDRTIPVSNVRTMEQIVGISVANRRFSTALLAGFALLALVLAGIGTYGVISYGVSQRSFEIGVRRALGAGDRSVLTLVMSEGLRMAVVGLGLGLLASAALGRGMRSLLVGVSAIDAPTLAAASLALLAVTILACLVPARRAAAVSPITAIRGP